MSAAVPLSVACRVRLDAPPDAVWAHVRRGEGAMVHPGVFPRLDVAADADGTTHRIAFGDDGALVQRLVEADEAGRAIVFEMLAESRVPFDRYRARVVVGAGDAATGGSVVRVEAQATATPASAVVVRALLRDAWCLGLDRLAEAVASPGTPRQRASADPSTMPR